MFEGKRIEMTDDGFLINRHDWTPEIASKLAAQDGFELTEAHWEILYFVQEYYAQYQITPIMRILGKAIARKLGAEQGKSRYLYGLFSENPVRQSARLAGLPKPPSCI